MNAADREGYLESFEAWRSLTWWHVWRGKCCPRLGSLPTSVCAMMHAMDEIGLFGDDL